jgi:acetyltransferase EpsM
MLYIIGTGTHSDVIKGIIPSTTPLQSISSEFFKENLLTFQPDDTFICALGDNAKRMEVVQNSHPTIQFAQWINAIHISAVIAENIQLGRGNVICAGAVIQTHAQIGNHCIINTHSSIDHHCKISDFVHVAPNVAICGSVHVGEGLFIGTSSSVMPKLILAPWNFIKAGTLVKHSTGPIAMYQPYIKESFTQDIKM